MTAATIDSRILTRLDEDGAGYYSSAEARAAANEAQRVFVLLTLCLEATVVFPLTATLVWYHVLSTVSDWLLPLRIRISGTGGAKVSYSRLADLDALNQSWQAEPGVPEDYAHLGFDLLAVHPQPADDSVSLAMTYARSPALMMGDSDVPDIPEEYHPSLVDYAIPRMRVKEGGDGFTLSLKYLDRFLADAQKLAEYVRTRNKAQGYDRGPYELRAFDRSRLVDALKGKRNG